MRPNNERSLTSQAITATLHCLTGCAIGEILGMVLATWLSLHNAPSIILAIVLAFVFGYSLTIWPMRRTGMNFKSAFKVALVSDTVSITSMELVDNAVVILIPGAMAAGLTDGLFWWSLALSLVVAFIITVPVNRWLISRGLGHAHHHHMSH